MYPIISLIIPVYLVEDYLSKCLISLINQGLSPKEYEIIIINDGSPDNSQVILENFKNKHLDYQIEIIQQNNSGLSVSRNVGLLKAKGNYIWFIDSDDWIEDGFLKRLEPLLVKNIYEILVLTTYSHKNSDIELIQRNLSDSEYRGKEIYKKSWIFPYSGAQFYIYKRTFLLNNNFFFKENVIHEDLLFTPQVLIRSNKVLNINYPAYHYLIRKNSLTQQIVTKKHIYSLFSILDDYSNLASNHSIYNDLIGKILLAIYRYARITKLTNRDLFNYLKEEINNRRILRNIFKTKNIKYLLGYFLLKFM